MVIGPGAKLEGAVLLVKREITDFDFAGRLVDSWWEPGHLAVVGDHDIGVERDFICPISTEEEKGRREAKEERDQFKALKEKVITGRIATKNVLKTFSDSIKHTYPPSSHYRYKVTG